MEGPHFIDLILDKAEQSLGYVCVVILSDLLSREEHLDDKEHRQWVGRHHESLIYDQVLNTLFDGSYIEASVARL